MNDKNGPAFACASENGHQEGMSKRELFAAMAMQGMVIDSRGWGDITVKAVQLKIAEEQYVARASIALADALLAALKEGKDG